MANIRSNRPLRRFVIILAGTFVGFLLLFHFWIAESAWFEKYLAINARFSASVLRVMGTQAVAEGVSLRAGTTALEIRHGCDALQPTAFFIIAMLASPVSVSLRGRLVPVVLGVAVLLILNIVRIVSLLIIQMYKPNWFDLFHMDIWQAVFIFLPLLLWIAWALRVTRAAQGTAHVAA